MTISDANSENYPIINLESDRHIVTGVYMQSKKVWIHTLNTLNAELNPICHLLALLGAHHILHVSRIRVNKLSQFILISYKYRHK